MTPSDHRGQPGSFTLVVTTGMVLGLIVGFLDVMFSILSHSEVLASFPQVLPPLATTTVVVFLGYNLVWYMIAAPIGRLFKLDATSLLIAVAVFIGGFFWLVELAQVRPSPTNAIRYAMLLLIAVLLSVGSYAQTKSAYQSPRCTRSALIALGGPWIAALVVVFAWLEVLRIRSPFSAASITTVVVLSLSIAVVLGLLARRGSVRFCQRGVHSLALLVIVSSLVTVVAASRTSSHTGEPGSHSVKHVILLTVDTLRPDALSCYGDDGTLTPNIDELAADGVRFTDVVSAAPWTLPAISSIMSGLSPPIHLALDSKSALHDSVRTLAEYMQAAGYVTAAIGSNPMLGPGFNLTQGFDEYNWFPKRADDTSLGKRILRRLLPETYPTTASTQNLTNMATEWVEAYREQDWFLWLHSFDPHHPYAPPPQYQPSHTHPRSMGLEFSDRKNIQSGHFSPNAEEREWIKDLYLSEVRYVDDEIGRFIGELKRLGIYDDALIVLTSDHGEEFWEHDGFEHGHTLYRELLSVPMIVKLPGQDAQREVPTLVTTQSITPTILDLCRVEFDASFLEARSLAPLWSENPDAFEVKPIFSSGLLYFEQKESVTFENAKYIRSRVTGREEVYDRVNDPNEQIPTEIPGVAERARLLLDGHYLFAENAREHFRIVFDQNAQLDGSTLKRLKALGYM